MAFGMRSLLANNLAPYNITTFLSETCSSSVIVPTAPPVDFITNEKLCRTCPRGQKILTCFSVNNAEDTTSCAVIKDCDKLVFTTDPKLAIIPAGAIIDSIEFFGDGNFATKDVFSIGLGQLNKGIAFPLIQETDSDIANEGVGGCREFFSCRPDGKNEKNIVLYNSTVNIDLNQPILSGTLQIVLRYHFKIL